MNFVTKYVGSPLHEITGGEVISIDGKTICNSDDKSIGKQAIHVVSAYTSAYNLCLGQQAVDEKSNEITAIPLLLDLLFIKNAVITIDAMGCQKQIASKIIEKEANYVLMVKDNQKQLKEDIELTFGEKIEQTIDSKNDLGHGRIEIRTCYATEDLTLIRNISDWTSIKSLVKIESQRTDKQSGKTSIENRYYISSLPANASNLNDIIRKHWGVENKLHWVLDVVFKEDLSLKKKGNSALNFNIINKIAINLLDKDIQSKKSKPIKRQTAAMDDAYREKLLNF
jgi:predicted transposase YbfD/YdcC